MAHDVRTIFIATSNSGKLRDFAGAASHYNVQVAPVPGLDTIPPPVEDAPTFEANACKKAEHYSCHVQDKIVLADDSGLVVDILNGAPGVRSARYAADEQAVGGNENSCDRANNARLLRELASVSDADRTAHFVCMIAVALNGRMQALFRGTVNGVILHEARGTGGFGYDPLFYIPDLKKTFAELTPEEKATISHRGQAFQKFLAWYEKQ